MALRTSETGYNNGTNQVSATLTGVQAGDLLTVQFRERDGVSITGISDTVNGAWSLAVTRAVTAARAGIYYFQNSAAGNPVVTITFAAGDRPSDGWFAAWSGMLTSGVLGATNSGGNNSATTHSPGSITPASSAVVLVAVGTGGDHGGASPPVGFTLATPHGSATANRQIYAYKTGHTGAVTASPTTANAVSSDAVVASFLESAGAPASILRQMFQHHL